MCFKINSKLKIAKKFEKMFSNFKSSKVLKF